MIAGHLVREARRRAGLSQDELADRVGTTQSAIARLERGRAVPTLERTRELIRACGLELRFELVPIDESDLSLAQTNRTLTIDGRLRQNAGFVSLVAAGRGARAEHV
jgi:ribosome-binding protein aMBF1 (putative translation factor)